MVFTQVLGHISRHSLKKMRISFTALTAIALAWATDAQQAGVQGRSSREQTSRDGFKPVDDGGRRLDAFDDRMAGYEAKGKYWEQWAIDHGYAPGPDSKYGKKHETQQALNDRLPDTQSSEERWVPMAANGAQEVFGGASAKEFDTVVDMAFYEKKARDLEAWARQEGTLPFFTHKQQQKQEIETPEEEDRVRNVPRHLADATPPAQEALTSYYKALGEWQKAYWEAYAKQWVNMGERQGFVPSEKSNRRAATDGDDDDSVDVPRRLGEEGSGDAFDERIEEYKASAAYLAALGEWEKNYWTAYGDGWAHWAQDRGFAPSPNSNRYAQVQEDDKSLKDQGFLNRFDAMVEQESAYWREQSESRKEKGEARGQAWLDWAVQKGYMPPPEGPGEPQGGSDAVAPKTKGGKGEYQGSRRLDAFDDRMARYEAIGQFETEYWKKRGKSWEQWAVDQGYAPGPDSKYRKPVEEDLAWQQQQQQQQQQQHQQPMMAANEESQPMPVGGLDDKAEAIRGDFYKADGRNWAEWLRARTFGEDSAEEYAPTHGYEGKAGAAHTSANKIGTDVGADGAILLNQDIDRAVEDVYKHQTWMGRSTARVVNGMENGAEHAYAAGERIVSRAGDRVEDAVEAYDATVDDSSIGEKTVKVPAEEPVEQPAQAPKQRHMRGAGK
jgi:hypothetical protein